MRHMGKEGGKSADDFEDVIDRKLGVLVENMNDQFQRVLEAVESHTSKIPKMSERIEKLESDMSSVRLDTMVTRDSMNIIKIRTEKLDDIVDELKDRSARLTRLEAA